MEPKLIKGLQADYVEAPFAGVNTSGIKVMGKNVLVMVDECSVASMGGVMLPVDMIEKMTMASTTGVICAVAPEGFRLFEDNTPWIGEKPGAGDRIWFEKYAGQLQVGRDGKTYRIMDYRAVAAVMEPDTTQEPAVDAVAA